MQTIALIIVLQVMITLLTGCSEFETKMEERNQLNCRPDVSECSGFLEG
jgi:hypothetical protein